MGARSRTGEPGAPPPAPRVHAPRTRTQHPTPTPAPRLPPNQRTRTRRRRADTLAPGLRPSIPASPQRPGLATLTVPGAQSARSSVPGPHPQLASAPLPAPAPVPVPQGSAPRWWQQQRGGRACVRARALVRGRAPAFPCAPAPASCPPRSDASRISNARSHPPGLSHSRARAPLRRTPGSARPTRPPGATTKSPERGPRCSLANLRPPSRLASSQVPWGSQRGALGRPCCATMPRRAAVTLPA